MMSDLRHHVCFSKIFLPWILALVLIYGAVKPGAAFVALSQPRTRLSAAGSDNARAIDRCSGTSGSSSSRGTGAAGGKATAGAGWSIAPRQRRKHRGGGMGRRGASWPSGIGGLKAAMDFPPIPPSDLADMVGRVAVRHHWQSGFIGGSVGVMGTLMAIQLKINEVKELTSCPYCRSSGQLACATCYGTGSVAIKDTVGASTQITTTTLTCPCCRGKTYITCINCKGDGRSVPLFLNKKVSRDPESEIEDVGYA